MAQAAETLYPSRDAADPAAQRHNGILPSQMIRELIAQGEISAAEEIPAGQVQPASLDLRLGDVAYRVRASFMPGGHATVIEKVRQFGMHEIDLTKSAVLERGCVYIVPLMERLKLGPKTGALANPKSSTGRLDVFTRVITDRGRSFDRIERGYEGPLYAEIAPRTFSIVVRRGSRLSQLRLVRGAASVSGNALRKLMAAQRLVEGPDGEVPLRDDAIGVTLDLRGDRSTRLVGYKAKKHADLIDVEKRDHYHPSDYWDPIYARAGESLVLDPDDFYILATRESVAIPPDHAAEMVAYDTMIGEFRVHYAGFFDPGFGYRPGAGPCSRGVLEVRSHEVPFMLEHGQTVGWLRYEQLLAVPDKLYGPGIGSSYQEQGLALGKQFKQALL